MLVKFFRKDTLEVLIIFALLLLALWIKTLMGLGDQDIERTLSYGTPLELVINQFALNLPSISTVVAFLITLVVLYMMQSLNNQFIFVPQRSLLPSLLYVMIGFSFISLQHLTPALAAMPIIILSLKSIFTSYRKDYAEADYFLAGFYMALAAVVYLPALAYLLTIIFSVLIMRPFSWREWVATFAGLLVPFIFLATYYLLFDTDGMNTILALDPGKIIAAIPKSMNSFFGYGFLGTILLALAAASFFILTWTGSQKVRTNKIFLVFFSMIGVGILSYVLIPTVSKEALVIMALPLSYVISVYMIFSRRTLIPDALLLMLLSLAVLLQIFVE